MLSSQDRPTRLAILSLSNSQMDRIMAELTSVWRWLFLLLAVTVFWETDLSASNPPPPRGPHNLEQRNREIAPQPRRDSVSVLGPLTSGDRNGRLPPPRDAKIIRAWDRIRKAEPRHNLVGRELRVSKVEIADYLDPPRHVPLIGRAQLRHTHYKCTIEGTEQVRVEGPGRQIVDRPVRHVIFVDHNHFHVMEPANELPPNLERPVSIDLEDLSVAAAVAQLAQRSGIDIALDPAAAASVEGKIVSLQLATEVPIASALPLVLRPFGLTFRVEGSKLVVLRNKK